MEQQDLEREAIVERRLGRRSVVAGGLVGGLGLAAAALVGCGDEDEESKPEAPAAQQQQKPAGDQPTDDYVRLHNEDGAPPELPYNYPEPDKQPKPGGIVRIATGLTFFGRTFDMNEAGAGTATPGLVIADRLIGYVSGPKMSKYRIDLQPELARSWEVSPDGLQFTFRLQPGVKYQNVPPINGRLLKAEDIRLALERAGKQGVNVTLFEAVDRVTAPDDQTVRVTMKRPDPDFLIPLGSNVMPIYAPELYDQNLLTKIAIGTGPGILEEVDPARILRIKSNPDYWQGKPLVEGIEWRNVPDIAARVAAFRSGQVEHGNTLASSIPEVRAVKASIPEAQITGNPILSGVYQYIPNAAHPKFKDARVRQALSLAIDRERLIQLAFQGYGKVLPGLPWIYLFDKTPSTAEMGPWFKYDPAEARKLLAAAGSDRLEFELKYNALSAGPASVDAQNSWVVQSFREVGVTMKLTNMDSQAWNTYFNGRRFAGEPGEAIFGYVTGPATATGFFHRAVHSKSPGNVTAVNDPQIDEWAEKQSVELNAQARKQLLRRIWDRMLSEIYHINAGSTFFNTMLQPWVRYWRMNGPLLSIYSVSAFGYGYHKGWLDK